MPKRVNHHERKNEIIEVFLTCASSEGLHNVTLRSLAAHAGISLRQIQYYFGTKDALVQEGLRQLEKRSHRGFNERLSALPDDRNACTTLLTLFEVALPTDTASRQFHLLWMSYAMMSLTNPHLSVAPLLDGTNYLQSQMTKILTDGVRSGMLREDLDAELEAIVLLGLINGLGTAVLLGQQTAESATRAFTTHVNRLR